ncbi:MAG: RNA polymerase sigma factor [Cyclonatronaceae bacterium]
MSSFTSIRQQFEARLPELYPRIERAIRAYTAGTGLDSEDLAQETFLKAAKSLHQYQETASLYTWLYRIARNTCIDEMRKLRRKRRNAPEQEFEDGRFSPPPANTIERREQHALFHKVLAGLPDEARELIILKDLDALKYEEITEIMQMPEGTVKSKLFRARLLLKKRMIQAGYEYEDI